MSLTPHRFSILVLIVMVGYVSCTKKDTSQNTKTINFSSVQLTMKRGAFHDDTFILKDTVIIFHPNASNYIAEKTLYNTTFSTTISTEVRDAFMTTLIDRGIWTMDAEYNEQSTCTSMLHITLTIDGQTKTIHCDDYQRGCPELIQYIENEMIRLHGRNLKRIFLPG